MSRSQFQNLYLVCFTAVFVGYFSVWLPGPAAGLSFIGLEMGEWIKFMGMGPVRNWFYLPPISLGLMLVLWSWGWPNGRLQTWLMRGTAVAVSLLSFPAIEDLMGDSVQEYTPRLYAILLVIMVVGISYFLPQLSQWQWLGFVIFGLAGIILPTWVFAQVRPFVSEAVGLPVGIGLGVWLNILGHGGVAVMAVWQQRVGDV